MYVLSKTMRIYGNFEQFGKWSEPDPGFDGHIVVEEDGSFMGYQCELYGAVAGMESLHDDLNKLRFVIGCIAKSKDDKDGIAYIKLSRNGRQAPLMYVVPNLEGEGDWSVPGSSGYFEPQGQAKVSLEDVPSADDIAAKIKTLREAILADDDPMNIMLLEQAPLCRSVLKHIE